MENQLKGAGKDLDESLIAGSHKADAADGSPAEPRDGTTNTFRGSRLGAAPLPNPVEALYYEGMAAYQHRRWDEALKCFTRLKELQPTRPGLDALLDEVRWFMQLQAATPPRREPEVPVFSRTADMRDLWRRLMPLYVGLLVFLAVLGIAGLLLMTFQGRLPWQNGANQEIEELSTRGQERLAVGDYDGAEAAYQRMLGIDPDSAEAKLGIKGAQQQRVLAQGYAAAGAAIAEEDWERASNELATILALDPNYPNAQTRAGFVEQRKTLEGLFEEGARLIQLNRWEEAIAQFQQLREMDASYRSQAVNEALFVCYMFRGEELIATQGGDLDAVKRGVQYFEKALTLDPRNPSVSEERRLGSLYLAAMQAAAQGDLEGARSGFDLLVAQAPDYAGGEAMRQLYELTVAAGLEVLAAGDIPAALEIFEEAQGLPVSDTSAARQSYDLAKVTTPTPAPSPTSTAIPSPAPIPTQVIAVIPPTRRPPTFVPVTPTNTPVLVSCIEGYVRNEAGGVPLRDWTITLQDTTGTALTAHSGDAGQYSFSDLKPGTYEISITVLGGWQVISPPRSTIVLAPAAECLLVDFWNKQAQADQAPTPWR